MKVVIPRWLCRYNRCKLLLPVLLLWLNHSQAQDLDPRAYVRLPVKTTSLALGGSFSQGGVVTDPTLPITNVNAKSQGLSLGLSHTFALFGLSAQALVALPYSWAQATGDVGNQQQSITRSGFADMRMRLSVLLLGGKAGTVAEVMREPRRTILGLGLHVVAPTGQFYSDKLINLGTNRWSMRPELALSQPIGQRWLMDVYAGLWLFGDNKSFYPGDAVRKQDPMGSFQAHLSYNIRPVLWVAVNATYYVGGQSSINNDLKDDRQSNVRIGITGVLPTGRLSSLKLSASTGAVVRIGQDFTTYSIGWQNSWIGGMKKKPATKKT